MNHMKLSEASRLVLTAVFQKSFLATIQNEDGSDLIDLMGQLEFVEADGELEVTNSTEVVGAIFVPNVDEVLSNGDF